MSGSTFGGITPEPSGERGDAQGSFNDEASGVNPGPSDPPELSFEDLFWAQMEGASPTSPTLSAADASVKRSVPIAERISAEFIQGVPEDELLSESQLRAVEVESRGMVRGIIEETSGADLMIESPNLDMWGSFALEDERKFCVRGIDASGGEAIAWLGLIDSTTRQALSPISPAEKWSGGSKRIQVKTEDGSGSLETAERFPLDSSSGEPPVVLVAIATPAADGDGAQWRFEHRYSSSILQRSEDTEAPLVENLLAHLNALGPERPCSALARAIQEALESEAKAFVEAKVMELFGRNPSPIDSQRAELDNLRRKPTGSGGTPLTPHQLNERVDYYLTEMRTAGFFDLNRYLGENTGIQTQGLGTGLIISMPLAALPKELDRAALKGPRHSVRRNITVELSEGDYGRLEVKLSPLIQRS